MKSFRLVDPSNGAVTEFSKLGLGLSQVGSFGNPSSPSEMRRLMRGALDLGVTVFDTADIYGQGDSERELGMALAGRRDEAFVVTKFGKGFSTAMRLARPFKPVIKPLLALRSQGAGSAITARREDHMREDFSPLHLRRAIDASLKRLRFNHVDALLLHSPPRSVLEDPATGDCLAAIKASGKARHVGASLDHWDELAPALTLSALSVLQLPIDMILQASGSPLGEQIAARGIAVLAREVIRLQPGLPPVDAVAQAAARPDIACVIAGTRQPAHLAALARACA
jgi:aryl-alcohol dehydrogenase-like predicted oxidoreductase